MTTNSEDAEVLISIAERLGKKIFVDHTFLYSPAVRKLKELVTELGSVDSITSVRANFGIIQHDVSVLWDLAVHDLAIIQYLFEEEPLSVSCIGYAREEGLTNSVAYLQLKYPTFVVSINTSWLSPIKIRQMIVTGSEGSLVYDDIDVAEKIRFVQQELIQAQSSATDSIAIEYRLGDTLIPAVPNQEPLAMAMSAFFKYVSHGETPPSSANRALSVLKVLEAAEESIRLNASIPLRLGSDR